MTDTDVRHVLTRATDHLSPAPDLLDRVRTGGRRRVVRRRAVLGGALAVAAAAGTAPVLTGRRDGSHTGARSRETRGDLAGDEKLLERMRRAWRNAMPGASGSITVHWAGSTPAGPVGLLSQASAHPGLDVQGFVETVDGRQRGLSHTLLAPGGTLRPAALVAGAQGDLLVIVTGDQDVHLSEDYEIDAAGRVTRSFVTLHGDIVFQRPVRSARYALRHGDEPMPLMWSAATVATSPSPDQPFPRTVERVLAGAPGTAPDRRAWDVAERDGYLDPYGSGVWTGPTQFYLRGVTGEGCPLVVQTLALNGAGRAFYLTAPAAEFPDAHYLGDPAGVGARMDDVPVLHLRLPGELGVAVAAPGCGLRYRVRDGSWLPVAGDAALIPAAATELEVEPRPGRSARFVLG